MMPGWTRAIFVSMVLGLALLLGVVTAGAQEAATTANQPFDVAVVVNAEVPVEDLSRIELRKILLGDRKFWEPGKPITILIQAPVSHERDLIISEIMDMTEAQFRQYWISKVFRAEAAKGPKVVVSNEIAVTLVNNIPGAMALVSADDVGEGLKEIRIDGALPGDAEYSLRTPDSG